MKHYDRRHGPSPETQVELGDSRAGAAGGRFAGQVGGGAEVEGGDHFNPTTRHVPLHVAKPLALDPGTPLAPHLHDADPGRRPDR